MKTGGKYHSLLSATATAARAGAWQSLPDWVLYRTPLRSGWAKLRGHRFHRNTLAWFKESDGVHTRLTLLLARLRMDFPEIRSLDMDFEFYNADGSLASRLALKSLAPEGLYVLDSTRLPAGASLPSGFDGSVLVKQTLHLPDAAIQRRQGLFSSTHTYLDYYSEGGFVTTLHDYCAYLPDQGLACASLGMIPARADDGAETFLVLHAAKPGIGARDLKAALFSADGRSLERRLPAMKPFSTKRWRIGELFPEARAFLGGRTGQVTVSGVFRGLLTRIAYGVVEKTGAFALDHCYYSVYPKTAPFRVGQREKVGKGSFNPFVVFEDGVHTTTAYAFGSSEDAVPKEFDLLVYDVEGKLVARRSPYGSLAGNTVLAFPIREALEVAGVALPFVGHAEILHHATGPSARERDLHLNVEYAHPAGRAHVIFGSDVWNPPHPPKNRAYRSANRVVCDAAQTTDIAITNCSYAYDYAKSTDLRLSLVSARGEVLCSERLRLGPNATFFADIESVFPEARRLLAPSAGVGLTTTTDIDCAVLTHLFFTRDRRSGGFSAEHSLDV